MDVTREEKRNGNNSYKIASKSHIIHEKREKYMTACVHYGRAIESLMKYESEVSEREEEERGTRTQDIMIRYSQEIEEEMTIMKPQLFLNLAMSNYQLDDYDQCRRCCNTALVLCNHPNLPLSELGIDQDISFNTTLMKPIIPLLRSVVSKVLYWRSKVLAKTDIFSALSDIQEASELLPQDQNIACLKAELVAKTTPSLKSSNNSSPHLSSTHSSPNSLPLLPELTVNGGWCCQRRGYWSQTVAEVVISLPSQFVQSSLQEISCDSKIPSICLKASDLFIQFNSEIISISLSSTKSSTWNLPLSRPIISSQCYWSLEYLSPSLSSSSPLLFLTLYLTKSLHISPPTSTPSTSLTGGEWWECVCIDDERIDTLLCSIGSDISQLPQHARERAERENQRYQSLSEAEKDEERNYLIKMKKDFQSSLSRVEKSVEEEEETMKIVPERGEFLRQLREEFPHIDFVSK